MLCMIAFVYMKEQKQAANRTDLLLGLAALRHLFTCLLIFFALHPLLGHKSATEVEIPDNGIIQTSLVFIVQIWPSDLLE